VFSSKRWFAEGTQETVRDVIRQPGYRPNNVARSLRTRRSRMVAAIIPDITNTFHAVLARGQPPTVAFTRAVIESWVRDAFGVTCGRR
jgi:DNA-binding LacI/PurR family transcriptional regulator